MRRDRVIMLFVCAISITSAAFAQESKKFGVVMGSVLGVLWQPTPSVAIRPEISFSHNSTKNETSQASSTNSSLSLPLAVSALFYMAEHDHLRTYVSPAFTYQRNSSESSLNVTNPPANTYGFRGMVGAQYAISERFSAFGEIGIGYAHVKTPNSSNTATSTSSGWSSRSGVGVILFF